MTSSRRLRIEPTPNREGPMWAKGAQGEETAMAGEPRLARRRLSRAPRAGGFSDEVLGPGEGPLLWLRRPDAHLARLPHQEQAEQEGNGRDCDRVDQRRADAASAHEHRGRDDRNQPSAPTVADV